MISLLKCPVCRARFQGDEPLDQPCRRCKSNLELIRKTYKLATDFQTRARRALLLEKTDEALVFAKKALQLVDEVPTRKTYTAALVARGLMTKALMTLEKNGHDRRL